MAHAYVEIAPKELLDYLNSLAKQTDVIAEQADVIGEQKSIIANQANIIDEQKLIIAKQTDVINKCNNIVASPFLLLWLISIWINVLFLWLNTVCNLH